MADVILVVFFPCFNVTVVTNKRQLLGGIEDNRPIQISCVLNGSINLLRLNPSMTCRH